MNDDEIVQISRESIKDMISTAKTIAMVETILILLTLFVLWSIFN